jgi:HNH endonuclease
MVPIVTGHLDPVALDRMVETFLASHDHVSPRRPIAAAGPGPLAEQAGRSCACGGCTCGGCTCGASEPLSPHTRQRLARAMLAMAAETLAGQGGLASHLRARLDSASLTSASLPLDVGCATETIPAHLRRAATVRHPHCAFPGCEQPASVCEIHHLIPRSQGGPTALHNLVPLCVFHHTVVIHRWGWILRLNSDASTTATSPDGTRILHSHSPPGQAAEAG